MPYTCGFDLSQHIQAFLGEIKGRVQSLLGFMLGYGFDKVVMSMLGV
jgi:hypothetical protein